MNITLRPSNSHGLAMRLTVWVVNSRSHDLAYSSHCESEIFKNLKIARQFQKESRNLKKSSSWTNCINLVLRVNVSQIIPLLLIPVKHKFA